MVEQGDIVWLDFSPTHGHEQSGTRPALVVSSTDFNRLTGLMIVCPITSTPRNYPTCVMLDERTATHGTILCHQLRTMDYVARGVNGKEKVPEDILQEVLDKISVFF